MRATRLIVACLRPLIPLLLFAAARAEDAPSIRGRVVDEQGRPVAGARVAPLFTFGGGARVEAGRTGPDGSFTRGRRGTAARRSCRPPFGPVRLVAAR